MFSPLQRTPCSYIFASQPKPRSSITDGLELFLGTAGASNPSLLALLLVAVRSSRLGHSRSVLPIARSLTWGFGKATVVWILAAGV